MSEPAMARERKLRADERPATERPPGDRLELVETFIRIAEAGGIGAAARSLGAAQPTVTRRLQQFEAILGGKLFERGPQGLSLTPLGVRLLPESRELAARWAGLEDLARSTLIEEAGGPAGAELSGRVRALSRRDLGSAFLPPLIAEFLAHHPSVRVDLRFEDGQSETTPQDLAADGVDFALRIGRGPGPGESGREIGRVRRALYAAPEAAERIGYRRGVEIDRCEPLALEGEALIHLLGAQPEALRFFGVGGGRSGQSLDVRFEPLASFDDLEPALDLALSGVALALLPTWRAAPLVMDGLLLPVARHWAEGETPAHIVWPQSRFRSAAASALQETISLALAPMLSEH